MVGGRVSLPLSLRPVRQKRVCEGAETGPRASGHRRRGVPASDTPTPPGTLVLRNPPFNRYSSPFAAQSTVTDDRPLGDLHRPDKPVTPPTGPRSQWGSVHTPTPYPFHSHTPRVSRELYSRAPPTDSRIEGLKSGTGSLPQWFPKKGKLT